MDTKSKNESRDVIFEYLHGIHNRYIEITKRIDDTLEENLDYMQQLFIQYSQPTSDPVIPKTPRILRKKEARQRIETIPENGVFYQEDTTLHSTEDVNQEEQETTEIVGGRSKRLASMKAASNIRKQQSSIASREKLKRPADNEDHVSVAKKEKRESHVKRKKSTASTSDEDDNKRSIKYSKLDENSLCKESTRKPTENKSNQIDQSMKEIDSHDIELKEKDDIITSANNGINEQSLYEDAIGKPTPLMNSTLNNNSVLPERILNATVVLQSLSQAKKLNETIIIKKASRERDSKETSGKNSNIAVLDSMQSYKEIIHDNCNGLITDDESSPDRKESNKQIVKKHASKKQRVKSVSSDDEIPNTPLQMHFKNTVRQEKIQEMKNAYKSNALFSPYAKESVKKRVEAFEQAVMNSPKLIDVDAPTRLTRTKTRAMAAAEAKEQTKQPDKTISAHKSPANAQKISVGKQNKDNEEFKENKEQFPERVNKIHLNDKTNSKQIQQTKTTPSSKTKVQLPLSINRLLRGSSNTQNLQPKGLPISRANIITNVESFIQPPKSITKTNSAEKLEDKKRYEEDARKKREESLRLMTEEKRRKREEKELKNRLAREAKEKQDLEKRQKAEREKEEKAKLALLMQEKQREEMEKKRLALLQRIQEKEERRKLEEQLKLQKQQEQEEAERLLIAQRRRDQEVERRKEAELRAQQQAAEALRQKQILAVQAKYKQANNKHQDTINNILDSESDDDERRKEAELRAQQQAAEALKQKRMLTAQAKYKQAKNKHQGKTNNILDSESDDDERQKEAELRAQHQASEALKQKQMLAAQTKYKQVNNKHQGITNYILDSEPDDDDSDDENSPKHEIPYWAQPQVRKLQLAMQRYIPQEVVYKFFGTRKCTPDLTELFDGIDRNRLKRTSSAIWKTPPRYSMMVPE